MAPPAWRALTADKNVLEPPSESWKKHAREVYSGIEKMNLCLSDLGLTPASNTFLHNAVNPAVHQKYREPLVQLKLYDCKTMGSTHDTFNDVCATWVLPGKRDNFEWTLHCFHEYITCESMECSEDLCAGFRLNDEGLVSRGDLDTCIESVLNSSMFEGQDWHSWHHALNGLQGQGDKGYFAIEHEPEDKHIALIKQRHDLQAMAIPCPTGQVARSVLLPGSTCDGR